VLFATLHVVGSNNNLQRNQAAVNESVEHNAANLTWLESTFAKASAEGTKAVVLFQQAGMMFEETSEDKHSGFSEILALLTPWYRETDSSNLGNFIWLEVYGSAWPYAAQIGVDTKTVGVFSFQPLMVAQNLSGR
jgi:hypothetical protein